MEVDANDTRIRRMCQRSHDNGGALHHSRAHRDTHTRGALPEHFHQKVKFVVDTSVDRRIVMVKAGETPSVPTPLPSVNVRGLVEHLKMKMTQGKRQRNVSETGESVRTATQAETIKSYVGSNWGDVPKEPSGRARLFLCLGRKIPQPNVKRLSARLLEGLARTRTQGAGTGGAYAYVYAYTHTRMRTLPVLPFWRTAIWSAIWRIVWSRLALRCAPRCPRHIAVLFA